MIYSEKVLDHFQNPRNVGEIPDADGVGTVGNAKCGDIMQMFIKVGDGEVKAQHTPLRSRRRRSFPEGA